MNKITVLGSGGWGTALAILSNSCNHKTVIWGKFKEEIENLETRLRLSPTYISSLKNEVSEEQMKLSRISDLVHTYEKIIEGNYIDNLVAAERERRQREEKQEEKKQDRTPDKKQAI